MSGSKKKETQEEYLSKRRDRYREKRASLTLEDTEKERVKNRKRNRKYRSHLSPEKKKEKYLRDCEASKNKKLGNLTSINLILETAGKRICSVCSSKKKLSEFSKKTKGTWKKICDLCLVQNYKNSCRREFKDISSPVFWRTKAYSVNSGALIRLRKRHDPALTIQTLDYKTSGEDLINLFYRQDSKCLYCDIELTEENLHIDHKEALLGPDTHALDNLAMSCNICNRAKSNLNEEEFVELLKELSKRVCEKHSLSPSVRA